MSEYIISKEDLLERLKARVAGGPARVVESLQAGVDEVEGAVRLLSGQRGTIQIL